MLSERYSRNIGAITQAEQEALRAKRVLIAGGGGLGGHVLAHMLRIGVGGITLCDFDVFDETNLNRQLLCTLDTLGASKAETAAEYAAAVNPDVRFRALRERLDGDSCRRILPGHDLVIDALDNVESRIELASACREAGLPLVYGAVGGWTLQAAVIMPEHPAKALERLYAAWRGGGAVVSVVHAVGVRGDTGRRGGKAPAGQAVGARGAYARHGSAPQRLFFYYVLTF